MQETQQDDEDDKFFFGQISLYSLRKGWDNKYDDRWDEAL